MKKHLLNGVKILAAIAFVNSLCINMTLLASVPFCIVMEGLEASIPLALATVALTICNGALLSALKEKEDSK